MSSITGRFLPRPRARTEGYAFCATDGFWYRPAYTDGTCPICGEVAPGAAPTLPLRMDSSWLGLGGLALESLIMLAIVLYMFFRG